MAFDPTLVSDSQKIKLTCDSTPISTDQTDFPLTVVLDGTDPLHAALFADLGANSKKLSIEAGGVQCPVEIESWDSVTEKAALHTKVPTYTAATDPELILSHDGSQVDNTGYVADMGSRPEVWATDAELVSLMGRVGGTIVDSTGRMTFTESGDPTEVDGQAGKAIDFDGTGDFYQDSTNDFLADPNNTDWSVSFSIKSLSGIEKTIITQDVSGTAGDLCIYVSDNGDIKYRENNITHLLATVTSLSSWTTICVVKNGTDMAVYKDGSYVGSATVSSTYKASSKDSYIGCRIPGHEELNSTLDQLSVYSRVHSADWISLTHLSLTNQLITFSAYSSGGAVSLRAYIDIPYGDLLAANRAAVDLVYSLLFDRRAYTDMLYSLRLGAHLDMYYGDCPELRQRTDIPYGDCPVLRRAMEMHYGDLLMLRHSCEMPYAIVKTLSHTMEMRYSIAESELRSFTDMVYDLSVNNPLRVGMVMPYTAEGDGLVRQIGATVTIGGRPVTVNHLAVEPDWGLYGIPAEMHLTREADFVQVQIGEAVEIVVEETTYNLIVDDKREARTGRGSVTFIVTALSPAVQLSADFARPLLSESAAGYHGTAQALVDQFAGELGPVAWNIDDYPVLPYTLFANDESPLEMIRKALAPVGAIIQSDPDGTIRIEYDEPNDWQTREPDYYISWGRDFISQDVTLIKRPGYNRFLVSGQMASEKRLWAEQQTISDTLAEVLGFMTPWDSSVPLVLEHSGGVEVAEPEYMGVVEEIYPTETEEAEQVEFVAGFAQTRRPIYDIPQVEWQREHLGAVTYAEDGRLEAEIKDGDTDGYSLASLRYLTRYHLWRVRDDSAGTIQYLLRRLDDEVSV